MSDTHAQTVAFVRDTMLPEQEPPATERGVVKWIRENLVSSWLNGVLTVLAILFIYYVLSHILPWFWHSVWSAGSLSECREIREATWGDVPSACFAVIKDRWSQLVFGFYPSHLYWRPILALLLFLLAIAPVLYSELPRKLLIFSAIFPFLGFWLLWGGSIWMPVSVALGFAIGYFAMGIIGNAVGALAGMIAAIVLPILYWLFLSGPVAGALHSVIPIGIEFVASKEFGGFPAVDRHRRRQYPSVAAAGYSAGPGAAVEPVPDQQGVGDLHRGDPRRAADCLAVHGVAALELLPATGVEFRPGSARDHHGDAVLGGIYRRGGAGGLAALPRGQYEAADSMGLDYWQSQRLIIMPQALKISIPGIVNTFIGLFKDTTLVVFIGLLDPIGFSNSIRASTDWNGIYWELFVFIGVMFWICCFSMSRYSQYLERKLRTDHR